MQAAIAPVAGNRRQRLLASLLERAGLKTAADRIPRRSEGLDDLPLSSGQRRLWFLDRVAPGNPVYNVPTCFRIRGPLDLRAFRFALNEIVRRHEILRTTFAQRNGEPVQSIAAQQDVSVVVVDLSEAGEPSFRDRAIGEARCPFDLERGPLIRIVLFRLGTDDHVVLITMHHIICDGWSMGILFRELAGLYAGAVRQVPPSLAPPPVQYADYAAWQRERFDTGKLEPQIGWWCEHLRHAPTVFELPSDRARPQEPSFRGAVLNTAIDSATSEALLEIARLESATPFAVLLAVYAVLLHRYSGQMDFIVGCPVSNRNRAELEPLIGFFPNTLPLRIRLSQGQSFLSLLGNLRGLSAQAFANAEAPFEATTSRVTASRSPHNPLFQVAFMMQEQPPSRLVFGDVEITPVDLDLGTAKCDLTLTGSHGPDGFSLAFEYSSDLFDLETIRRMAGHFKTLAEGIAANPETSVDEFPLMAPEEERQVLEWSRSSAAVTATKPLHELFEEHAGRQPQAPALVFGHAPITYSELNAHANRVAHALRECGAGPGALIAIALNRSPELIASILGVLKAGAAYLPIALDHPAGRISFQIEDANPMMLVTSSAHRDALPPAAQELAWLDVLRLPQQKFAESNPPPLAQPSGLAYVIYTSGSTGKPKGAMLEHRGLTNLVSAQQALLDLGPGARILQFAPATFDASVWEIAMALGSGGCLCLGSGASFVPEELSRVLREQRVTAVTLPPSILRTLSPAEFPELRTVVSAGENCPEALARMWSHGRSFFNAYGPTEATVCATAVQWRTSSRRVTIGRPIPNVQTYVLDPHMKPLPAGVPGELHIGGVSVARGYLNRPDLTRTRFVADPFDPRGGRLYKTGDLARYLPNGEIEFLGRIDGQLKVRGHRIEPGEIEARLESHPAVRECAVVLREEPGRDARLIAYFVPDGPSPGAEDLRAFAAAGLPAYMVPSAFVPLSELPVNSSGKIDRRTLAEREVGSRAPSGPARDDLERTIAAIWAEVLRLPTVGVADNFFELGGNSLMAVNLMAKIAARTGCDLPVTALFHAGTVEQIARCIRERTNSAPSSGALVRLQPRGSLPPLLLIPPAGGSLICYSEMARLFAPHQPVLGVEPPRGIEPAESVEALAARYIQELQSASFDGPFQLAGWSFGGNIAFEMACQLASHGKRVDSVFLLDSYANHKSKEPGEEDILLEIARVQALARGVELRLDRARLRRLKAYDPALAIASQMDREPGVEPETIAAELRTILQRFRADMRAARRYKPGCYGGRVVLLRTSAHRWSGDHGWSRVCPGVEVRDVPGTHRTLLAQPHVAALVRIMRDALTAQPAARA
jgi:amino acid adenylation domain-containing protein